MMFNKPFGIGALFFLFLLFILSGCARFKVENNTIYSELFSADPDSIIRIDPEFTYIGPIGHNATKESVTGRKYRYEFISHVFLRTDGRMVKKGISVELEKIESFYREDLYRHVPYRLESGDMTFGGRTYQYIIALIHPKSDNYITAYISRHGNFKPPSCGLGFIASRVYGKKKNQLVGLRYFEDIAGSGFDCPSWENRDHLTSEQLMYLKHFKKRFLKAFEFIPRE